jgi:gluconokinase
MNQPQADAAASVLMRAPVVVMGVSGSGKTTVGQALADALRAHFIEGDAFHPPANVERMRGGLPLTDAHRAQWLDALASELQRCAPRAVLACSALKRAYRDRLRAATPGLRFVFLDLSEDLARRRTAARHGAHFFPTSLVTSQFATLEPPVDEPDVIRLPADQPIGTLVTEALAGLQA